MKPFSLTESFALKSETFTVKKGEFLLRNGEKASHFFYVKSGCLRSYIIDHKGKEHIVQFAPEDWVIGDQDANINNKPALFNIDAVEDSVVLAFKRSGNMKLDDMNKEALMDMAQKFHKRIIVLQKRIIQLMSATAEERYREFNLTYPSLSKRLPQKMIASYLGITPESLSRVRKELVSKK